MTTDVATNGARPGLTGHQMASFGAQLAIQGMTSAKVQEITHVIEEAASRAAVESTGAALRAVAEAHDSNLLRLADQVRQLPDAPTPGVRDMLNGTANRRGYVSRETVLQLIAGLQSVR